MDLKPQPTRATECGRGAAWAIASACCPESLKRDAQPVMGRPVRAALTPQCAVPGGPDEPGQDGDGNIPTRASAIASTGWQRAPSDRAGGHAGFPVRVPAAAHCPARLPLHRFHP
jgi:hypothetical protein